MTPRICGVFALVALTVVVASADDNWPRFRGAQGAHRWMVYDVDFKTGRIRWERQVAEAVPSQPRHQKNSYAAETPVTDGERVYAYFGNVGLFAFDMNGTPLWSKLMAAAGPRRSSIELAVCSRSSLTSPVFSCIVVGLEAAALKPWINPIGNVRPQPDLDGEQRVDFDPAQLPALFTELRERSPREACELEP